MKIIKQERVFDVVPDAVYSAEVIGVSNVTGKKTDPETGEERTWDALKFRFRILDADPTVFDKQVTGQVYASGKTEDGNLIINPGTPLDKWLAVLGVNMEIGGELSPEVLKGKQCTVIVTCSDTVRKGKKWTFSNVTDIKHLTGAVKPALTPVAPVSKAPSVVPVPVPQVANTTTAVKTNRKINF